MTCVIREEYLCQIGGAPLTSVLRSYEMKFKIYPWVYPEKDCGVFTLCIGLIPAIDIDFWKGEDELEKKKWWWLIIVFSWLVFGVTFDWRSDE